MALKREQDTIQQKRTIGEAPTIAQLPAIYKAQTAETIFDNLTSNKASQKRIDTQGADMQNTLGQVAATSSGGSAPGTLPGYRTTAEYLDAQRDAAAPPNVYLDQTRSNQLRDQQMSLGQALANQANGIGPSLAQMQLQKGVNSNLAASMAMAASQRGMGRAAALRGLGYQSADIRQQGAQDAAMLRLQEQQQAQNTLGQLLAGTRGQDMSEAGANLQAALTQRGMNDANRQYYTSQGLNLDQLQASLGMDWQRLLLQRQLGIRAADAADGNGAAQMIGGLLSAGGQIVGTAAGGMFGGPVGGAAGGAVGSQAGKVIDL